MGEFQLVHQLNAFKQWKQRQIGTLRLLEPWLKKQGLFTSEIQRAIRQALVTLSEDRITVAIVGEFSRGKTELLNALFFGDHGQRLLPTDAGRTTMCPTELFQDNNQEPYLRLLPIETRLESTTLLDLRKNPERWIHIPLNLDDTEDLKANLQEITASYEVSSIEAARLGLYQPDEGGSGSSNGTGITIPKWRLAQLNFRHPLLEQGLRLLDTPGLNAVGNEPELTFEILPNSQAKLFVLGIDTGVTRSDLEIWQEFIKGPKTAQQGVMVVLNKVDTLWDELRSDEEVANSIQAQCKEVSLILGVDEKQVYATSAQKALLSRVRKDELLEKRTGILEVENYLANTMVRNRQELIIEQTTAQVQTGLNTIEAIIVSRLKRLQKQAHGLKDLSAQSDTAIRHMLRQAMRDKLSYRQSIEAYRESLSTFQQHGQDLLNALDINALEQAIERARKKMTGAWTTRSLKEAMRVLFDDINHRMETASSQTQAMRRLIRTIYRRFQSDHKFETGQPPMFSIITHQVGLSLVHQESEIFRKSPLTTLTEQHFAVRRYFQTIVRRTREIFRAAHNDAGHWLNTALDPLTLQVKEHRDLIAQQLEDVKHAGQSRNTVKQRIGGLSQDIRRMKNQIISLRNVKRALSNTTLPEQEQIESKPAVRNSA